MAFVGHYKNNYFVHKQLVKKSNYMCIINMLENNSYIYTKHLKFMW